MFIAYKYKLRLTKSQEEFMKKSFGCARVIYNYALNERIEAYSIDKKSISQFDLCKKVVQLKKQDTYKWLSEVDHQTLACAVRNLDKAYTKFFREKKGFPKFKSKHDRQSCQFTQGIHIDFDKSKIKFPKLGWVNFFNSRTFKGSIKTVTVSRNSCNIYFASILVDNEAVLPCKPAILEGTAVGIDMGIKTFATLSDGQNFDNPKYYEKYQKRLAVLQRGLSRKKKGGSNYKKQKLRVAKLHYKITNQREDFLHKFTSKIISENQTVIIEDLNIEGMLKNPNLAKSISSASWGTAFEMLKYKADWYGANIVTIGRFDPSSKIHFDCGFHNKDLILKDRQWICQKCGKTVDRDLNAALNIKRFGLTKQNLIGHSGRGTSGEPVES